MTKIGVIADSHRRYEKLREALLHMEDCAYIVHLGDHDSDVARFDIPENRLYTVPGNCDPLSFSPVSRITELDGVRIFMTHGHAYGVKQGLTRLALRAREAGARVVLYGHTHVPSALDDGRVLCLNPGALQNGKYALVFLDCGTVRYELKEL
ncbi:MAG: metallophosphoesterase [Clostridia bacterium]|nr:metallophosphoesterase [Clostridia bacterium]